MAVLLCSLAAVVWIRPLGWAPIDRLMEASEVQEVEQMALGQGLVLPLLPDGSVPEKPPLMHWLAAASMRLLPWREANLSLNEAAVRLPSAVASIVSVLALWLWARRRLPESTAVLASLLFMVTYRVATMARTAWVDATFSAWVAIAVMLGFELLEPTGEVTAGGADRRDIRRSRAQRWRPCCFWLCIAGATLTKGPLGAVLPALVLLVWSQVRGRQGSLRALMSPWWAMILAAAGVGGWYVAAYVQHGYAFLDKQLVKSYFQRFVSRDPDSPGAQPPWYFLVYFFPEALPASVFFPFAAWEAFRHRRGHPDDVSPTLWTPGYEDGPAGALPGAERAALRFFLVVWVLVFVAFFSLSAGKRKVYLLPCYPAVALLVGDWISRRVRACVPAARPRRRRLLVTGLAAAFAWAALVQPTIDRAIQTPASYKDFASQVRRGADAPIAAVGVADYFPLTVYLTPWLRFCSRLEDVPPDAQHVIVARELVTVEDAGTHAGPSSRPVVEAPPGWEVGLSTEASHGFAERHPVLLLSRRKLSQSPALDRDRTYGSSR